MKKYLVAEYWVHCFVGSQESYTDWVLDVAQRKLVYGALIYGGRSETLDPSELACLQEDVDYNVLCQIDEGTFDDSYLEWMDELPDWAQPPKPRQLELPLRAELATLSSHRETR